MRPPITHILPEEDIHPHKECICCQCEPVLEIYEGTLIVAHNAFDGRDVVEMANEIIYTKQ